MAKKRGVVDLLKSFKFNAVPYDPDKLQDFIAAEKNHNVFRVTAILAKKADAEKAVVDDVVGRADEAFMQLLGFTAVQCPYCNSIVDEINDDHLLACAGMHQKYTHAPDKWTLAQCKADFPDQQLVSWSLQHQRRCLKDVAVAVETAQAGAKPDRPAVVDKKRSITSLGKKIEMPQRIQPSRTVPAVTTRKHAYDPKKAGWNR